MNIHFTTLKMALPFKTFIQWFSCPQTYFNYYLFKRLLKTKTNIFEYLFDKFFLWRENNFSISLVAVIN